MIEIEQHILRVGKNGALVHPFIKLANVTNRCASRLLQRRIVDFSAERSYAQTAAALEEHYGIKIPLYTIDVTTTRIAQQAKHHNSNAPANIKPTATLISEVDGTMLPFVNIKDEKNQGTRRHRRWHH